MRSLPFSEQVSCENLMSASTFSGNFLNLWCSVSRKFKACVNTMLLKNCYCEHKLTSKTSGSDACCTLNNSSAKTNIRGSGRISCSDLENAWVVIKQIYQSLAERGNLLLLGLHSQPSLSPNCHFKWVFRYFTPGASPEAPADPWCSTNGPLKCIAPHRYTKTWK